MKRSMLLSAVLLAGAGAFTVKLSAGPTTGPTTAPSTQPVNKFCAVMHEDEIDPAVTYVYKGKTYGFCCKDCIPKFKSNPEKYAKNAK